MSQAGPRDDLLVSIGIAESEAGDSILPILSGLAAELSTRFRYWELLIVTDVDKAGSYAHALETIANVRLLKVRPGTSPYRRRVAIAGEAIGDVVLISTLDEIPQLTIIGMIEKAGESGAMVVGRRRAAILHNAPYRALGASAGFRVDASDMLTTAYPRTVLNRLLSHPDPQLALRFPPNDDSITVLGQPALDTAAARQHRSLRDTRRRFAMLQKLLVGSAPRVLGLVGSLALLVAIVATVFVVYALVVWLVKEDVQPGWLTTSLALGLTAFFLGCAIFGLSIGLQKLIDLLSADLGDDVVDEITSVDLFREVFDELNIEQDKAAPALPSASGTP
jgi:hypothetical protein